MRVHDGELEASRSEEPSACAFLPCSLYFVWVAAVLLLGPAHAWAAAGDPPGRVARLAHLTAHVSLEPAGTDQWTQAVPNTPLTTGDRLYVNHDGHAELQMGMLAVRAWKFTDLSVVKLANDATQLGLAQGSLHVRTFALTCGQGRRSGYAERRDHGVAAGRLSTGCVYQRRRHAGDGRCRCDPDHRSGSREDSGCGGERPPGGEQSDSGAGRSACRAKIRSMSGANSATACF